VYKLQQKLNFYSCLWFTSFLCLTAFISCFKIAVLKMCTYILYCFVGMVGDGPIAVVATVWICL
jgi:hypothetical protein